MSPAALLLGRVAGVPVRLRPSWFLVAGALVLLFGPQVGAGEAGCVP